MKMTQQFEKKLKALAEKLGMETNFSWDLGWFDFYRGNMKLGSVRFYGYDMETKRQLDIYVVTAFTKICYYESGIQWSVNNRTRPLLIWEPTKDYVRISQDNSEHQTISFSEKNEPTEEIILSFLEVCFTRCMRAKYLDMQDKRMNSLQKDF